MSIYYRFAFNKTPHKTDKRLFAKIQEWFDKLLERFKKALKTSTEGVKAQSSVARVLNEAGDDGMHLFNSWSDAFASVLENSVVGTEAQVEDGTMQYQSRTDENNSIRQQLKDNISLLDNMEIVASVSTEVSSSFLFLKTETPSLHPAKSITIMICSERPSARLFL